MGVGIVATSNGGQSWTLQTSGTMNILFGVAFTADGRSGWAVGLSGTIVATSNGGQSWTPQTSGTTN